MKIIDEIHRRGWCVWPTPDGKLGYRFSQGEADPEFIERLREAKPQILALFRRVRIIRQIATGWHTERHEAYEERAAIMQHDAGMDRVLAELAAFEAYAVDVDRAALATAMRLDGQVRSESEAAE